MKPSTGYGFNTMQDIKSHSSVLYNERMAILFYLLDMKSIELNNNPQNIELIKGVRSLNKQIYKNVRTLVRNNPVMRNTLNLNTSDDGIYITDVMEGTIDQMFMYCQSNGYTVKQCYILVNELNDFEMQIKDVLQYYNYFIRPNFMQKPDIMLATEKYKSMADDMTVQQLKQVAGKNNKIDFDNIEIIEPAEIPEMLNEISDEDEPE